jgi:hypothetical protein
MCLDAHSLKQTSAWPLPPRMLEQRSSERAAAISRVSTKKEEEMKIQEKEAELLMTMIMFDLLINLS